MADDTSPAPAPEKTYAARVASEEAFYRDCEDVHQLPEIFHYWSNRYVKPKLQKFGFNSPDDAIRKSILEHCQSRDGARIVSIGSGNCELEVELAVQLRAAQCRNFAIDCLDLNPSMLERGRAAAELAGVIDHLNFVQTDLNRWTPSCSYDAALANQSLHHVLNLEGLFQGLTTALDPGSPFVISDMIGRNGHQRWPEALRIVQEFWRQLPPSHRFNHKLNRYEENFENRDYSKESFEGIRAQDILPLLRSFFEFDLFIAFANVIDPFVDSAIGENFDTNSDWDRNFIDRVHARDEEEQLAGRIKPTHMVAAVRPQWSGRIRHLSPLTPEFCERRTSVSEPKEITADPAGAQSAYDWQSSPYSTERELEIACSRLKQLSHRIGELEKDVEERTLWALGLDREIAERNALVVQLQADADAWNRWGKELDAELAERTAWAQRLNEELEQGQAEFSRLLQMNADVKSELETRTEWALDLARQLEERTAWALRLQEELAAGIVQLQGAQQELERLTWARALDRRFHNILHGCFQMARRLRHGLRGR